MTGAEPLVTVLLATRNGAEFLGEQLTSIRMQRHQNWALRVSDDGSTDTTLALLETFQREVPAGRVIIVTGPGRGATANFLALLAGTGPQDGCLAFCDQDDIWLSEKLERAVAALAKETGPTIYACAVVITDAAARGAQVSARPKRAFGFQHALAENMLTGNSMVLNPQAADLVRKALAGCRDLAALEAGFHDWLCLQLVTAAAGRVIFDPVPGLRYRQHLGNLVGSGQVKGRIWTRLGRVFGGEYGARVRRQAEGLLACPDLTATARRQLTALLALRGMRIWQRGPVIRDLGLYRQRSLENLVLQVMLWTGRI